MTERDIKVWEVIDWSILGWELGMLLQNEGFHLHFESPSWFDFDTGGEG
jgi:hypothetical protein